MGVPGKIEGNDHTSGGRAENPYEYESIRDRLFAKLAKFLAENEHTKGKRIEILREYPTSSATAFLFEIRVPRTSITADDIHTFAILKGINSPLKAIGEIVDVDEAQYVVSLKMDISH